MLMAGLVVFSIVSFVFGGKNVVAEEGERLHLFVIVLGVVGLVVESKP